MVYSGCKVAENATLIVIVDPYVSHICRFRKLSIGLRRSAAVSSNEAGKTRVDRPGTEPLRTQRRSNLTHCSLDSEFLRTFVALSPPPRASNLAKIAGFSKGMGIWCVS